MLGTPGPRETSPASSLVGLFISSNQPDRVGLGKSEVRDERVDLEGVGRGVSSDLDSVLFGDGRGEEKLEDSARYGHPGLLPPHPILSPNAIASKPTIPSLFKSTNLNPTTKIPFHHTPTSSTSSTLSSLTTTTTTTTTTPSIERTPTLDPAVEGSTDDDDPPELLSPGDDLDGRGRVEVIRHSSSTERFSFDFGGGMSGLNPATEHRGQGEKDDTRDGWTVNTLPRSFASLPKSGSRRKVLNARGLRVDVRTTFGVDPLGPGEQMNRTNESHMLNTVGPAGGSLKGAGRDRSGLGLRLGINTDLHRPSRAVSWSSSASPSMEIRHSSGFKINLESHTRPAYQDGAVEVVQGVWIGNEESVMRFESWVGGGRRGMVVNVAKELGDPFEIVVEPGWAGVEAQSKAEVEPRIKVYSAKDGHPEITYLKLDWTHGETELAKIGPNETGKERWGFDETIRAMEVARREGEPILIQWVRGYQIVQEGVAILTSLIFSCQCGISRSATLVIAYVLFLSHHDLLPPGTNGLPPKATMWQVNDYVKEKSEWIAPNVS